MFLCVSPNCTDVVFHDFFLHYASPHPRGAEGCVSFHSRLSSLSVVGFCKLQGHETQKTKPFWMMLWYINVHNQRERKKKIDNISQFHLLLLGSFSYD